jgi:hypothetical protein
MYEVKLSCGHTKTFTVKRLVPKVGKRLVCTSHEKSQAVEVINWRGGWKAQCLNCIYNKQYGTDKGYAKKKVREHYTRYQSHVAVIYIDTSMKDQTIETVEHLSTGIESRIPF